MPPMKIDYENKYQKEPVKCSCPTTPQMTNYKERKGKDKIENKRLLFLFS